MLRAGVAGFVLKYKIVAINVLLIFLQLLLVEN